MRTMRRIGRAWPALMALCLTECAHSSAGNFRLSPDACPKGAYVLLVSSGDSAVVSGVTDAFIKSVRMPVQQHAMSAQDVDLREAYDACMPSMVVALGLRSARAAREQLPEVPMVYALVVQDESHTLFGDQVPCIGLDLPPEAEFMMYKLALPKMTKVLAFYTSSGERLIKRAAAALTPLGVELQAVRMKHTDVGRFHREEEKIKSVDAIWWLNDKGMLSTKSFDTVLALTRRAGKPILASTFRDYAVSGALMAFALDYENIGGQIASQVMEMLQAKEPAKRYEVQPPLGGHLVLNSDVAQQLGVEVPLTALPFIQERIGKGEAAAELMGE